MFQISLLFAPFISRRKSDTSIYKVSDEILRSLSLAHEYVAVYFSGPGCRDKKSCQQALSELETIDDELEDIGIVMVTLEDTGLAKENGNHQVHFSSMVQNVCAMPLLFGMCCLMQPRTLELVQWCTDLRRTDLVDCIDLVDKSLRQSLVTS